VSMSELSDILILDNITFASKREGESGVRAVQFGLCAGSRVSLRVCSHLCSRCARMVAMWEGAASIPPDSKGTAAVPLRHHPTFIRSSSVKIA
jgi:hypothetical protein